MRKLSVILIVLLIISCQNNDPASFTTEISGYHKIVSMTSDKKLDLNNDGIQKTDLYSEMSEPHHTTDGEPISFMNFDSPVNYMEVRPLDYQTNDARLISFNFPHQYLGTLTDGTKYLYGYLEKLINFTYEIEGNNVLVENHSGFGDKYGAILSLQIMEDGNLKMKIKKELFDFKSRQWISATITAKYKKTDY